MSVKKLVLLSLAAGAMLALPVAAETGVKINPGGSEGAGSGDAQMPAAPANDTPPQPAPPPSADFLLLEQRATQNLEFREVWRSLRLRAQQSRDQGPDRLREAILSNLSGRIGRLREGLPLEYAGQKQVMRAQVRAEAFSSLVRADLNGDWQISRDELLTIIRQGNATFSSDTFIMGDTNTDYVLDFDEMKAAANAMADLRSPSNGTESGAAALFDLDGDGTLTPAEIDRSVAALRGANL